MGRTLHDESDCVKPVILSFLRNLEEETCEKESLNV